MLDIAKRALDDARAETREFVKSKGGFDKLSEADRKETRERLDRIERMERDVDGDAARRAEEHKNLPWDETVAPVDQFGKSLASLASFKFARTELDLLRHAAGHGTSYQAKAVQAESALGPSAGTVLDLTIAPAVRDAFRIATLIPARPAGDAGNDITYYRPSALAAGATSVAEAAAIPQSSPEWEAKNEPIRKVAHYAHIPDEALQDYSNFQSLLSTEMMQGIIARENAQLLLGDGTAPNLAGIFDDSRSTQTRAQGTDLAFDAILKAIMDVREDGFVEPDAIIMRASDWVDLRTAKNAIDDYYLGGVAEGGAKSIDGVPVYLSTAATAKHVYVGQFSSLRAYIRKLPTIETSNSADDDFTKDLSKVRVVERFALGVPSGAKFCDLTLA